MKAIEMNQMIETILEMMVDPETGVVLDEDEALKVAEEYEAAKFDKCEAILKWVSTEKYKIDAMENQKKNLDKMIKTKKNLVERLSKYVAMTLDYQKWETPDGLAKIQYRTTKDKVTIDDIDAIPIDFFKTPRTESNLSKTEVKEVILNGSHIPGVHLEDSTSIIIKG